MGRQFTLSKLDAELMIEVLDRTITDIRNKLDRRSAPPHAKQMWRDRIAELYEAKRRLELQFPVDIREAS